MSVSPPCALAAAGSGSEDSKATRKQINIPSRMLVDVLDIVRRGRRQRSLIAKPSSAPLYERSKARGVVQRTPLGQRRVELGSGLVAGGSRRDPPLVWRLRRVVLLLDHHASPAAANSGLLAFELHQRRPAIDPDAGQPVDAPEQFQRFEPLVPIVPHLSVFSPSGEGAGGPDAHRAGEGCARRAEERSATHPRGWSEKPRSAASSPAYPLVGARSSSPTPLGYRSLVVSTHPRHRPSTRKRVPGSRTRTGRRSMAGAREATS